MGSKIQFEMFNLKYAKWQYIAIDKMAMQFCILIYILPYMCPNFSAK